MIHCFNSGCRCVVLHPKYVCEKGSRAQWSSVSLPAWGTSGWATDWSILDWQTGKMAWTPTWPLAAMAGWVDAAEKRLARCNCSIWREDLWLDLAAFLDRPSTTLSSFSSPHTATVLVCFVVWMPVNQSDLPRVWLTTRRKLCEITERGKTSASVSWGVLLQTYTRKICQTSDPVAHLF